MHSVQARPQEMHCRMYHHRWFCVPSPDKMQILPELKAVVQTYWNALHAEFTADRSRLEKWRVMQCVLKAASALRSLVAALSNPFRTTPRNRTGVAPVIQAQELASNRELLTLSYRVQVRSPLLSQLVGSNYLPRLALRPTTMRRLRRTFAEPSPLTPVNVLRLMRLLQYLNASPLPSKRPSREITAGRQPNSLQPNSLTSSLTTWIVSSPRGTRLLAMYGLAQTANPGTGNI